MRVLVLANIILKVSFQISKKFFLFALNNLFLSNRETEEVRGTCFGPCTVLGLGIGGYQVTVQGPNQVPLTS